MRFDINDSNTSHSFALIKAAVAVAITIVAEQQRSQGAFQDQQLSRALGPRHHSAYKTAFRRPHLAATSPCFLSHRHRHCFIAPRLRYYLLLKHTVPRSVGRYQLSTGHHLATSLEHYLDGTRHPSTMILPRQYGYNK